MKSKIILFFVVATVFFGCSTPADKIQSTYNKEGGEGLVVGTIYIQGKSASGYTFKYRDDKPGVADYPNDSGKFSCKFTIEDFTEKKPCFLFSIVKPKGKYKFYTVQVFDNSGQEVKRFNVPMDIDFEVIEGKTTYLGQINVNIQKKEFSVENQIDRDRAWFAKKAPQIQF